MNITNVQHFYIFLEQVLDINTFDDQVQFIVNNLSQEDNDKNRYIFRILKHTIGFRELFKHYSQLKEQNIFK